MLDAGARAFRGIARHLMFRPAHGVAHFAGQGLAVTGSQRRDRPEPGQHLYSKNCSRNPIRFHSALISCEQSDVSKVKTSLAL
jgi:hypothetical protein